MSMEISAIAYGGQIGTVNVTLPSFKVTMNGESVNNAYSKYPLIVYNNITYFPMTYSDCRYLGIESTWKGEKEGLLVDATGVTAAYNPYKSASKNGRSYTARIPSFPIKVNGKAIDNSKEQYPLLSFRDITYFPMTWKYGVEQFGWDYSFDGKNGLVIKSKNIKLQQITLLNNRSKEEYSDYENQKGTVIVKSGYVYYCNKTGGIMRTPLSNTSKAKKILQLEKNIGYGGDYYMHSFYEENGKAMLFFHSGGAVMGEDHRVELNSDGTIREIQDSYTETTAIGDKLFMLYDGQGRGPGGLSMQKKGQDKSIPIGSSDYWYYSLGSVDGISKFSLVGNQLYLGASKVLEKPSDGAIKLDKSAVYKINIDTNEVTKVSNQDEVGAAQIEGDYLYYISRDSIYKVYLKDGGESLVSKVEGLSGKSENLAVIGGKIYFSKNSKIYTLGNNVSLNPNAEITSMNITGDNMEYLVCRFKETINAKYRIMIFDKNGKVVFKTSDCGSNVTIEGKKVYFYDITTEKICTFTLN